MDEILATLAFAVLIGAQFLAAVVLISKRKTIYADPGDPVSAPEPRPDQSDQQIAKGRHTAKTA
jgi:hypothetical protein